jgi:glycosyltransferase involved in cell wall biosynthesis
MRGWRPAIVHTHDNRAPFYAGPASRLIVARRPRVVQSLHGRNAHASRREIQALRHFARLADRFFYVSDEVLQLSVEQGISRRRMRTVHNGIDTARFAYQGPCSGGPVVTVARLSPEKDLGNLVRAMALLARDRPGARAEIAGDGAFRGELEALAAELGVADRVTFLGESRDVPAVLARAALFALPSKSEGIPLTLLEAMARDLPAVAMRVGGIPEVVAEGQTGYLVSPSDPSALGQVLDEPAQGQLRGRAGRQRVEQQFDVRRMVADYEATYRELLGIRHPY